MDGGHSWSGLGSVVEVWCGECGCSGVDTVRKGVSWQVCPGLCCAVLLCSLAVLFWGMVQMFLPKRTLKVLRLEMHCSLVAGLFLMTVSHAMSSSEAEDGCLAKNCPMPDGNVLFMTAVAHMCPESDVYGKELLHPFVSRLWNTGGIDDKIWQLRTITVYDTDGHPHHLLFPFVINSGGLTPYVGYAAYRILRTYGAIDGELDDQVCKLSISLPLKTMKCAWKWGDGHRRDQDKDIRNNMIGVASLPVLLSFAKQNLSHRW